MFWTLKSPFKVKHTNRKAYLHRKSYHLQSTKESIAYGQATGLQRICNEESDFQEATESLKKDHTRRGYDEQKIASEITRATALGRRTLRTYHDKERNNRTPLVVTYHKKLPKLKDILEESWSILQTNETEGQKFRENR